MNNNNFNLDNGHSDYDNIEKFNTLIEKLNAENTTWCNDGCPSMWVNLKGEQGVTIYVLYKRDCDESGGDVCQLLMTDEEACICEETTTKYGLDTIFTSIEDTVKAVEELKAKFN